MKKLFLILTAIISFSGLSFAQTAAPMKQATTVKAATTKSSVHVTKDGSLDKRYKENKTTVTTKAAVAGPVKKDGTPDMRYKANKTTKTVQKSTTN